MRKSNKAFSKKINPESFCEAFNWIVGHQETHGCDTFISTAIYGHEKGLETLEGAALATRLFILGRVIRKHRKKVRGHLRVQGGQNEISKPLVCAFAECSLNLHSGSVDWRSLRRQLRKHIRRLGSN